MILTNLILIGILIYYFIIKAHKAIHVAQQSAYDPKRLTKYILEEKKFAMPNFEFCGLILVFLEITILKFNSILANVFGIAAIIVFLGGIVVYQKALNRFVGKLSLKLTARIKRLIVSFGLLLLIFNLLITILGIVIGGFGNNFSQIIVLLVFVFTVSIVELYFFVKLALITNEPIEARIRLGFQKQAQAKLAANKGLRVIGITGSYGKTSIKNILNDIISDFEPTLMTPESFNTPNGLTITVNNHLTKLHRNFIAEMGAYYEGEIEELCNLVSPSIGIISSIGPQHLETFGSIETIQKTKMELIESLPTDGLAVLNFDNEYIRNYQVKNSVKQVFYSITDQSVDLFASNIQIRSDGLIFDANFKDGRTFTLNTRLLGRHSISNLLAAILVADYLNYDLSKLAQTIQKVKPIAHRLELKKISNNLTIIDDAFNGNVEGIKEGIDILSRFEETERIIITPGLIDLGQITKSAHIEIGKLIGQKVDKVVIVGKINYDALMEGLIQTEMPKENISQFDNFIDGYNSAIKVNKKQVILIANDLPDKFNK
ncbi:MAG: Mur ligase family protein [Mycoplasmatales bacterium]